jgi:hypothetical protein
VFLNRCPFACCSCTTNACDAKTGKCTFAPIKDCCKVDGDCKHADACQEGKCNGGKCVYKPKVCNDKNACTTDSCEKGICKFVPRVCDDKNKCTDDRCDPATGKCQHKPRVCDDKNP